MGSSFSAEQFYDISVDIYIYAILYLYGLSAILAVFAIEIMRRSQGWHNFALTILLLNILLYAIASFAYLMLTFYSNESVLLIGLYVAADNFCHWIITSTYITTSLETRMLLNKDTYLKSADEMVFVPKFRCYLTTANISASILIIAIGASYSIAYFYENVKLFHIAV